ncbi:MAG: histidine kinase dimerization/phospho-acceptor domain-containing protein, partial [Polyangiaceae bacterium]
MHFNLATTISLCAATTCSSLAVLGAYLGQASSSRHFRYASIAGFAAAVFCITDAAIAARLSVAATVWFGRVNLAAVSGHGAAWLAFLAAWDHRPLSKLERVVIALGLISAVAALVPGWVLESTVTERLLTWANVTYGDPDVGPMAMPFLAVAYVEQVVAAVAAFRMSRHNPKATMVAVALCLFCVVMPVDVLSATHVLALPYLADPALALVFLSVGSVVIVDAAESAAKSAELERARVALAERENLAALGQLAGVVAHEVRNPVAIIFGALANLQRAARDEADAKLLGIIGEEAARLKELVSRLLDAVRPFELEYSRHDVG